MGSGCGSALSDDAVGAGDDGVAALAVAVGAVEVTVGPASGRDAGVRVSGELLQADSTRAQLTESWSRRGMGNADCGLVEMT
jgi:hypothetical protein